MWMHVVCANIRRVAMMGARFYLGHHRHKLDALGVGNGALDGRGHFDADGPVVARRTKEKKMV
jgi:hypothetical protein